MIELDEDDVKRKWAKKLMEDDTSGEETSKSKPGKPPRLDPSSKSLMDELSSVMERRKRKAKQSEEKGAREKEDEEEEVESQSEERRQISLTEVLDENTEKAETAEEAETQTAAGEDEQITQIPIGSRDDSRSADRMPSEFELAIRKARASLRPPTTFGSGRSPGILVEPVTVVEPREALDSARERLREEREDSTSFDTGIEGEGESTSGSRWGPRVLCQMHGKDVVYSHSDLIWTHRDDGSHCEELDRLPHSTGGLTTVLERATLMEMAKADISREAVVSLADQWIESFKDNMNLAMLEKKWALVLIGAVIATGLDVNYEEVGTDLKRLMEEVIRKLVIVVAIRFLKENPDIILPDPDAESLVHMSHEMAEYLLTYWEISTEGKRKASRTHLKGHGASGTSRGLMGELKLLLQTRRQIVDLQTQESRIPQYLANLRSAVQLGDLDEEQHIHSAIESNSTLTSLLDEACRVLEKKQITMLLEKSKDPNVLAAALRRLLCLASPNLLDDKISFIGIIGIAMARRVEEGTGFSTDLLSLENLRIARWIAWFVRNMFPALAFFRIACHEIEEMWER